MASCGDNHNHDHSKHEVSADSHNHSHHEHDHAQESQDFGMVLDNGKKWKMDDHTRSMFIKMVSSFTAANHSSVMGLQKSGIQLKGQIDDLIKGCTMVGNAHNQLHVFLTGYIPAVEMLVSSSDLKSGRDQALKVKRFLDIYDRYFE